MRTSTSTSLSGAVLAFVGAWAVAARAAPAPGLAEGAPGAAPRPAALVELGRRLFFEPAASRSGRVACSSCHDPSRGFTDLAHPSQDEFGPMRRRSMPLTDLPEGPMHSDGEFESVRALVDARLLPFDQLPPLRRAATLSSFGLALDRYDNLTGPRPALPSVGERVAADGFYRAAFTEAFGDPEATPERVVTAIDAYTRSLRTETSPYDRFVAGDETALPAAAARGLVLFVGKAGCAQCHLAEPDASGRAPLRDGRFHDTGIAWRSALRLDARDPRDNADPGRGAHGDRARERREGRMKFKTPSLRDVSRRGPFMHDGSLATLGQVVDYYDRGGAAHPGLDPALRPLRLSEAEKDDLVAFLLSLSAPERAGLGEPPAWLGRVTSVRIVRPDGEPLAGTTVRVEPAGDGFRGVEVPRAATIVRADARGRATFRFPPTTHARIRVEGHGVAGGRLLPDVAGDVELVAVPEDCAALRVTADEGGLPERVRATPTQVTDGRQRVTVPREGDPIEFERVRRLSATEGLYVARLPKGPAGSARRVLSPRGGHGAARLAQADVDFSGGAITTVDLRPVLNSALTGPNPPPGGLPAR